MVMTVAARFVSFGSTINVLIALTIAIAKTVLIVLYFMHVRFNERLVQVFVGAAFLWLIILFMLTMGDYLARDWPPAPVGPLSMLLAPLQL
jgi:cytochrome c oxidase subunit 4